jgi:hypothetical protein
MYVQAAPGGEWLPELDIDQPARQRRLTVLFRLLLLIPQYIVLYVLGIAAFVVAVIGWFAALVTGRLPDWAFTYLADYVAYTTRVGASESLLVDKYPPFSLNATDYPVRVGLRPAELNRLAVLLRIFLVIPAAIITAILAAGWWVCSFFIWLIVLILGRMPEALFESTAAVARYTMRMQAYWLMLTPAYPKRLFGDGPVQGGAVAGSAGVYGNGGGGAGAYGADVGGAGAYGAGVGGADLDGAATGGAGSRGSSTRPLLMTGAARVLLLVFIVLGVASLVTNGSVTPWSSSDNNSSIGTHR